MRHPTNKEPTSANIIPVDCTVRTISIIQEQKTYRKGTGNNN